MSLSEKNERALTRATDRAMSVLQGPDLEFEHIKERTCWFFDHRVTGEELNRYTNVLANNLEALRDSQIEALGQIIRIWAQVDQEQNANFKQFEASIERDRANNAEIRKANTALTKTVEGLKTTDENLKKVNDELQKTINAVQKLLSGHEKTLDVLKAHKRELDSYRHLQHIDAIWEDTRHATIRLDGFATKVEAVREEAHAATTRVKEALSHLREEQEEAIARMAEEARRRLDGFATEMEAARDEAHAATTRVEEALTRLREEQERARRRMKGIVSVAIGAIVVMVLFFVLLLGGLFA